ncbi:GrpB family protein [Macrococcus carouselicus]|uniref:GrpB family protein n=1 Tax=Macrococcus carouselicus TaxID=69969 RepID=A0A9Q8CKZ7_9STAP|nr:GrpB family protein [Macrococcus carouselicus]TDM02383.1 GrpB family protein [Macrococcus carouselicus]
MKVRLTSYDDNWKNSFEDECKIMREIFENEIVRFEHFGSTSVPGMKAKPVVDMMILVKDINEIDKFNSKLEMLGYDVAGEWGITGRRLLRKGGENRTHHIHIYQFDHTSIYRHLVVRDYLLEHPEEVKSYSEFKEILASKYDETREYSKAKKEFVSKLEQKAIKYYRNNN